MSGIVVASMGKIAPEHECGHGRYEYYEYEVTDGRKYEVASPREGNLTVTAFYELPPGKSNYPFHYHIANEEVFYVISGNGILETFDGDIPLAAGDIAVCPAGKDGAHRITNASETEKFVYLDVDTNNTPDIAFYPHTNKVGIRAVGRVRDNFGADGKMGYYEGE